MKCSSLADQAEAAVRDNPSGHPPLFNDNLTRVLRDEASRLEELATALDGRHVGVRPHRLRWFVAAVNHVKDVTGTYRDGDVAQILDALGVTAHDEGISPETIRKWRLRAQTAERGDPHRPLIARMRELWD